MSADGHRRSTGNRLAGDTGAVVAEFALILPFLATMMLGLFEFGHAYQRRTALEAIVSSANRAAVQVGSGRTADYEILSATTAGLANFKDARVTRVVVWKATGSTSGPLCTTGNSVNNVCNVYDGAQVATFTTANFGGTTDCDPSAWDHAWCPTKRSDTDLAQDEVGLSIDLEYNAITKIVPTKVSMRVWSVMRIEPPLGVTG